MIRGLDGSTLNARMEIVDDNDSPIQPKPGYPKVVLLDTDKTVISEYIASPTTTPGIWEANILLPELGVTQSTEYKIRWRCLSTSEDKYQYYDTLIVDPKAERRESDIVLIDGDEEASFTIPFRYTDNTNASYQIFSNNNAVLADRVLLSDPAITVDAGMDRSSVSIPAPVVNSALTANLLILRAKVNQRPVSYSFRLWKITPQIVLAATMIEDFLNKSRIENVIPELEYTYGDLLGYLERGLYLFNMTGVPTNFNGLNMQGVILDSWIICSSYWAISTQLIAEGSLAFDFSGQGVSLNVDRTPQLDSALGRIESRIQDTVLPLKKQMASQGILGGDGSQGAGNLHNPYSAGTLSLINAPTTRVGGWNPFVGRRF